MKKNSLLLLVLLAIASGFAFAGCATAPATSAARTQQLITDAAFIGTVAELQAAPESRPQLVAVRGTFQGVADGNVPLTAINASQILANAGQTNLLASLAVITFVRLADTVMTGTNNTTANVRLYSGYLATGMGQALDMLPASKAESLRRNQAR